MNAPLAADLARDIEYVARNIDLFDRQDMVILLNALSYMAYDLAVSLGADPDTLDPDDDEDDDEYDDEDDD